MSVIDSQFLPARQNPLNIERVTRVAFRFSEGDWQSHLNRLATLRFRCAIVGPRGTGKSTLLGQLPEQLHLLTDLHSHLVNLPEASEQHPELLEEALSEKNRDKFLLVDGIERLTRRQRKRLLRASNQNAGLIVSVHKRCELPSWIETKTSLELFEYVLDELAIPQPIIATSGKDAYRQANGNIREALRDLYDQLASGRFNRILSR